MTLEEQERAAYQAGDYHTAELLAQIVDAEADQVALEDAREESDAAKDRTLAALDDAHQQLTAELDACPDKLTKAELAQFIARLEKVADFIIEAYNREKS